MGIICLTVIAEPTHPGTVSPMDVHKSEIEGATQDSQTELGPFFTAAWPKAPLLSWFLLMCNQGRHSPKLKMCQSAVEWPFEAKMS